MSMIRQRILMLLVICLLIIGFDQWTKSWAISTLKDMPTIHMLGGSLLLLYAENTGAWGSMGSGLDHSMRFWLLTVLPFLFLAGLAWYTLTSHELKNYMVASYSFVIAGGIGNLIDRAMHGYVVDFLWVGIPGGIGTNIFNVADVAIMAGVITLIVTHFTIERKAPVS
jgi:signal peptidase II